MIKRKGMLIASCALLALGLGSCSSPSDNTFKDDNDYEQNDDFKKEDTTYSVVGTNFASWDPVASAKDEKCVFKKESDKLYTLTIDVVVGDEFKFVAGGTWNNQYGVEDMDWTNSTAGIIPGAKEDYNEGTSNRSNFKMEKAGKLTVEIHPYYFVFKDAENLLVLKLK